MSDYKHKILILMQVLHLLWVWMGRFIKQIHLYQRIYFLCSILETEHKPVFSYCLKTSLHILLTNLGTGSSVGTGCQWRETDISFENFMQTLEAVACMAVLTFFYPHSSCSCPFDGGGKDNESDDCFVLNEFVIAHHADAFSWDLSAILLSNSAGFSSTWSYRLY